MKPVYVKLTGVVSLLVLLLFLFGMQPLPAVDSLTGGLPACVVGRERLVRAG